MPARRWRHSTSRCPARTGSGANGAINTRAVPSSAIPASVDPGVPARNRNIGGGSIGVDELAWRRAAIAQARGSAGIFREFIVSADIPQVSVGVDPVMLPEAVDGLVADATGDDDAEWLRGKGAPHDIQHGGNLRRRHLLLLPQPLLSR